MISKGLKVGDTFVDGGRKFVIEKVVELGYISKMVEDTEDIVEETVIETVSVEKPAPTRGRKKKV